MININQEKIFQTIEGLEKRLIQKSSELVNAKMNKLKTDIPLNEIVNWSKDIATFFYQLPEEKFFDHRSYQNLFVHPNYLISKRERDISPTVYYTNGTKQTEVDRNGVVNFKEGEILMGELILDPKEKFQESTLKFEELSKKTILEGLSNNAKRQYAKSESSVISSAMKNLYDVQISPSSKLIKTLSHK
ncbi:MAG: hypothetical protein PF542_04090 [Nanoarchaeota archaeon]|jgi:hypothetical protein|nr:hypothetical protein [Nanoarchaeota archaeon]